MTAESDGSRASSIALLVQWSEVEARRNGELRVDCDTGVDWRPADGTRVKRGIHNCEDAQVAK
jgi:hypothetical protein